MTTETLREKLTEIESVQCPEIPPSHAGEILESAQSALRRGYEVLLNPHAEESHVLFAMLIIEKSITNLAEARLYQTARHKLQEYADLMQQYFALGNVH